MKDLQTKKLLKPTIGAVVLSQLVILAGGHGAVPLVILMLLILVNPNYWKGLTGILLLVPMTAIALIGAGIVLALINDIKNRLLIKCSILAGLALLAIFIILLVVRSSATPISALTAAPSLICSFLAVRQLIAWPNTFYSSSGFPVVRK